MYLLCIRFLLHYTSARDKRQTRGSSLQPRWRFPTPMSVPRSRLIKPHIVPQATESYVPESLDGRAKRSGCADYRPVSEADDCRHGSAMTPSVQANTGFTMCGTHHPSVKPD